MAVTLITGAPGAGKTLFTVEMLYREWSQEGRHVYTNIDGLDHDELAKRAGVDPELFHRLSADDVKHWHRLPDGARIIVDEAQHWFPAKNPASYVPEHIAALEEHRHQAHDVVIITQHPSLIHNHIKQFADHYHLFRPGGFQTSTLYYWPSVNTSPNPKQTLDTADDKRWTFPKELFGVYKSASGHTMKRKIPWWIIRKILLGVAVAVAAIGGVAWLAYDFMAAPREAAQQEAAPDTPSENCNVVVGSVGANIYARGPDGIYVVPQTYIQDAGGNIEVHCA